MRRPPAWQGEGPRNAPLIVSRKERIVSPTPDTAVESTTVSALLMAADVLHGLPGLPPVSVYVFDDGALTFTVRGTDDHARGFAVEALAAVMALPTPHTIRANEKPSYGTGGHVGVFDVHVQAPGLHVIKAVAK